ncbi:sulfotransferase domain-containing protein [Cupriavidus basilensis]|uniref:Sulfotransferase domain-containing protein n=1 Tax=Cupriavidus basilensis TaxID=68895 RepID=A0ABT6AZP7_9BURK|nr:sulfotransferase domain-containing protein [Cupriavidus basilensis]MDF3838085.1 sulfotransferase domain-containing protein [Cupriavidus basilensis]
MLRLALVSTPRSGNTWLRYLLARTFDLEQYAVHSPSALDWSSLPQRCIVQLHWNNTPEFRSLLNAADFRVITISRHPLDTLLSILHFSPNEPETAQWLLGQGGSEQSIHHKSPASSEFQDYCISPRAQALLSVTPQWWDVDGVVKVRYEDLVSDTTGVLCTIAEVIGEPASGLAEIVDSLSIENLRLTSSNQHFWKGQPGLWRNLILPDFAEEIYQVNQGSFEKPGYTCASDEKLQVCNVEEFWAQLD